MYLRGSAFITLKGIAYCLPVGKLTVLENEVVIETQYLVFIMRKQLLLGMFEKVMQAQHRSPISIQQDRLLK